MTNSYDVVILGGGPGGYAAAGVLADAGKRVAIVEEHRLGGVCLNYGCIPAKALLRSAEALELARRGDEFGWSAAPVPDYAIAVQRSRSVVSTQVAGMSRVLRRRKIEVIEGRGRFASPGQIVVTAQDGIARTIEYGECIVATGASAMVPAPLELGERIMTFREFIVDEHLPESILVVGGGPIGLEMAHVLSEFGANVTVAEIADQLLPREEPQSGEALAEALLRRGIQVHTSTRIVNAVEKQDGVAVTLREGDEERLADYGRVLVATGFVPNSHDLGLELVAVELDERGSIVVDDAMRTSAEHIYAAGDVTMRLALAHVAEAQGRVAASAILGGSERIEDEMYAQMPRVSYMQPQVASIGLREAEARAQLSNVRSASVPFARNSMAHARGDVEGFVKVIVHGPHAELAGAHIVGHDIGELLPELVLAARWDLGANEIADAVHAHPSLGETIQDAIRELVTGDRGED